MGKRIEFLVLFAVVLAMLAVAVVVGFAQDETAEPVPAVSPTPVLIDGDTPPLFETEGLSESESLFLGFANSVIQSISSQFDANTKAIFLTVVLVLFGISGLFAGVVYTLQKQGSNVTHTITAALDKIHDLSPVKSAAPTARRLSRDFRARAKLTPEQWDDVAAAFAEEGVEFWFGASVDAPAKPKPQPATTDYLDLPTSYTPPV